MKRIKSFKLFESNTELISVIKDMSLELTDKEFYFSKFQSFSSKKRGDRLSFILNNGKVFYFSDIVDVVVDMISFMESEGWSHRVEFLFSDAFHPTLDTSHHGDIDGYVKDGELYYYSEYDTEKVVDRNCGLENFILIFSKDMVRESFDDTSDILTNVKDMLLEISDMDYTTNCVIRRMDGKEYIRIGIVKPAPDWVKTYKHSFTYGDIKEYLEPIVSYLGSEGYTWNYNKGTHGQPPKYGDDGPYVVSSGSVLDSGFKSKIEMWFERGFDEVQSRKIKYGF